MPLHRTDRHAGRERRAIFGGPRAATAPGNDNMADAAIQGLRPAFRGQLTPQRSVRIAQVLPSVPRPAMVADRVRADPGSQRRRIL